MKGGFPMTREISIHAPRTGSDVRHGFPVSPASKFQSTLPARGATGERAETQMDSAISIHAPRTGSDIKEHTKQPRRQISIHAPRTGSDCWAATCRGTPAHFNPRSPHGERQRRVPVYPLMFSFQSTLPARGATCRLIGTRPNTSNFNPRSPHGERLPSFRR